MIRVIGFAFGVAILASLLSGGNKWVIYVAFFGALVVIAVPLLTGQSALRCPYCRKRVKIGATACHHCGRSISRTPGY
jgi:hypothetical protein